VTLPRVALGDRCSLLFTSAAAVAQALDETLRLEGSSGDPEVELQGAVAALAPPPGTVGAVLVLDSDDQLALAAGSAELRDASRSLFLEAGAQRVHAQPSGGDEPGAVPVVFAPDVAQWRALREAAEVAVVLEQSSLAGRVVLDDELRRSVLEAG